MAVLVMTMIILEARPRSGHGYGLVKVAASAWFCLVAAVVVPDRHRRTRSLKESSAIGSEIFELGRRPPTGGRQLLARVIFGACGGVEDMPTSAAAAIGIIGRARTKPTPLGTIRID